MAAMAVQVQGLGRAASPPLSAFNSMRTVDSNAAGEMMTWGSARSFGRLKGLRGLRFTVTDKVPFLFPALLVSLQHVLVFVGMTALVVSTAVDAMGGGKADVARCVSAALLASGLGTLLNVTFGSRLPLMQGPTFVHCFGVLGIVAYRKSQQAEEEAAVTFEMLAREVQGALISASAAQLFFGASGLARCFARLLSPVSLAPTILAIGLTPFASALQGVLHCPEVGAVQMAGILLLSQYVGALGRRPSENGASRRLAWLANAETYSVILPALLSWGIAAIVGEATGGFTYRSEASARYCRLDRHSLATEAPWVSFPPLFFSLGEPVFTWESFLIMLAATVTATWESLGSYNAMSRVAGAPLPRASAAGRGLCMEALGSIFSALATAAVGLGSSSASVGVVGTTKVGSRNVIQMAALWLILLGLVSRVGAFVAAMPLAIVCGTLCCTSGLISSVGISIAQIAKLNSPRNLFIMGFAIFNGLSIQTRLKMPAESSGGRDVPSSLLQLILWEGVVNPLVLCGGLALLLDTTVPASGSDPIEERGLHIWRREPNERYQHVFFLPHPIRQFASWCLRPFKKASSTRDQC